MELKASCIPDRVRIIVQKNNKTVETTAAWEMKFKLFSTRSVAGCVHGNFSRKYFFPAPEQKKLLLLLGWQLKTVLSGISSLDIINRRAYAVATGGLRNDEFWGMTGCRREFSKDFRRAALGNSTNRFMTELLGRGAWVEHHWCSSDVCYLINANFR